MLLWNIDIPSISTKWLENDGLVISAIVIMMVFGERGGEIWLSYWKVFEEDIDRLKGSLLRLGELSLNFGPTES